MRTTTPIEIVAAKNEKLLVSVKRAINNAYINSTIVKLVIDGIECLVYPNDHLGKLSAYVKLRLLQKRIEELTATA